MHGSIYKFNRSGTKGCCMHDPDLAPVDPTADPYIAQTPPIPQNTNRRMAPLVTLSQCSFHIDDQNSITSNTNEFLLSHHCVRSWCVTAANISGAFGGGTSHGFEI